MEIGGPLSSVMLLLFFFLKVVLGHTQHKKQRIVHMNLQQSNVQTQY